MYLYVGMYVYVYVCIHDCICIGIYMYTHTFTHVLFLDNFEHYVCVYGYVFVYVYVFVHVYVKEIIQKGWGLGVLVSEELKTKPLRCPQSARSPPSTNRV